MTRLLRIKLRLAEAQAGAARGAAAQVEARLRRTVALQTSYAPIAGDTSGAASMTRDRFAARLTDVHEVLHEASRAKVRQAEACAIAVRRAEHALARSLRAEKVAATRRARRRVRP